MKNAPLLNFALAVFLLLAIGWLLLIGRPILLPIVTAIISLYVLMSASRAMLRVPGLENLPAPLVRSVLLLAFAALVPVMAIFVVATVREIIAVAPGYEQNIDALVDSVAVRFGLDRQSVWEDVRSVIVDQIDVMKMVATTLGGFTNAGASVFFIIIYMIFLMAERHGFAAKLQAAFPKAAQAEETLAVFDEINTQVSDYLAAKTLINIVLGILSYAVLWAHGADFALFWAVVIALLNYIPYIGSYLGVFFPIVLSLAQHGSFGLTASLAAFLIAAQSVVGYVVEPRVIGKHVNLSPFVVLVSLSIWTALWGIPGAILAIPMTSIVSIVLSRFEATRFVSVLLANEVSAPSAEAPRKDRL